MDKSICGADCTVCPDHDAGRLHLWRGRHGTTVGVVQKACASESRARKGIGMKTLIVVESKHCGNTRKVAEAMAAGVPDTVVADTAQVKQYDLHDFALVGFGSGIYAGRFDGRIVRLVQSLCDKPANTFVFSTSGGGDVAYNQSLIDLLQSRNKTVLGSFACKGLDKFFILRLTGGVNKGCPTETELQNAVSFLQDVQTKCAENPQEAS